MNIDKMLKKLQELRIRWGYMTNINNIENYSLNDINNIEQKIKSLKQKIYFEYFNKVNGNYDLMKNFENKYLW